MLKEKVQDFIEDLANGWIDLACDDLDELESYGLEEGDEKDYARARLQEVADDVDGWFKNEFEFYDNGEFLGYDINDVKEMFKVVLKELGYKVK